MADNMGRHRWHSEELGEERGTEGGGQQSPGEIPDLPGDDRRKVERGVHWQNRLTEEVSKLQCCFPVKLPRLVVERIIFHRDNQGAPFFVSSSCRL